MVVGRYAPPTLPAVLRPEWLLDTTSCAIPELYEDLAVLFLPIDLRNPFQGAQVPVAPLSLLNFSHLLGSKDLDYLVFIVEVVVFFLVVS